MVLTGWTIYDHPSDRPDCFIARRWIVMRSYNDPVPTRDVLTATTLDELRRLLPPGLTCLPRYLNDDPKIVEVWI